MPQDHSFDVVSEFDRQELVNAVDQARREITTRYDFKGITVEITLEDETITLLTGTDAQLKSIIDVLQSKAHRRGIDLKVLDPQKPEPAAKGNVRQVVKLRKGIGEELARDLTKRIRGAASEGAGPHPGRSAARLEQGQGRAAGGDPAAPRPRPRRSPPVHQLPVTRRGRIAPRASWPRWPADGERVRAPTDVAVMTAVPILAAAFPEAATLGRALAAAGLTIAVAESCTGGLLGAALTAVAGSSAYVRGGVIAYADDVKAEQLGVGRHLLATHGAVSAEVAAAMATGVRGASRRASGWASPASPDPTPASRSRPGSCSSPSPTRRPFG